MPLEFLTETKAKLIDVNPRSEKRGPVDLVSAVDLRLQVDTTNAALEQLHPELCAWLYTESKQAQLPLPEQSPASTELRFPDLGFPLHWGSETSGYSLLISTGISDTPDIQLHGCKVHKVALSAKTGGTVQLFFTVSCSQGVTRAEVGELGTRVQHDVWFSLLQAEVAESEPD